MLTQPLPQFYQVPTVQQPSYNPQPCTSSYYPPTTPPYQTPALFLFKLPTIQPQYAPHIEQPSQYASPLCETLHFNDSNLTFPKFDDN